MNRVREVGGPGFLVEAESPVRAPQAHGCAQNRKVKIPTRLSWDAPKINSTFGFLFFCGSKTVAYHLCNGDAQIIMDADPVDRHAPSLGQAYGRGNKARAPGAFQIGNAARLAYGNSHIGAADHVQVRVYRKGQIRQGKDGAPLNRPAGIPVDIGNLHAAFNQVFPHCIDHHPRSCSPAVGRKKCPKFV
jgi:hypothetical protein